MPSKESPVSPFDFRVLTLNCWGLYFVSKDRRRRLAKIAEYLSSHQSYSFVFLQEIWITADYDFLVSELSSVFSYSKRFTAGVIGSGLCVFSKVPILHILFIPFAANGYFYKFWHGDWFSGKGVGVCRVLFKGLTLDLLTTHTHVETTGPEYVPHRVTQVMALVDLLLLSSAAGACDAAILAGDLNSTPDGLVVKLLSHLTGLKDSYTTAAQDLCHPSLCSVCFKKEAPHISAGTDATADSLVTGCPHGGTCGLPTNAYSQNVGKLADPNGWRLDYILYKNCRPSRGKLTVVSYERPLPNRIPGMPKCSYSDHEAVAVTFRYIPYSKVNSLSSFTDDVENILSQDMSQNQITSTIQPHSLTSLKTANDVEHSSEASPKDGNVPLINEVLATLNQSLKMLRLRLRLCVALALSLLLLLLVTVYEYSIWPTGVRICANLLRIVLSFLVCVFGVVQPILIRQEIHALESSVLSVQLKYGRVDVLKNLPSSSSPNESPLHRSSASLSTGHPATQPVTTEPISSSVPQ